MRESDFCGILRTAALVTTLAYAGVAVPGAISAQDIDDPGITDQIDMDEDDGMDWGWLGLLGLAGLLGLRRRDHVRQTDTTRRTTP